LTLFGALSIVGPKWCGKTWTALNHANSVVYLLDPENGYANREAARLNPAVVLTGTKPLLLDEWQEAPGIWDAVRFACDRTKEKGQFLLTGSVTPKPENVGHSGAGRIGRMRMRTMSLFESGDSTGDVSMKRLFSGEVLQPGMSKLSQQRLIDIMIRGGWPENIGVTGDDAFIMPRQYINALIETDLTQAGNVRRKPELAMQLLAAVARTNMSVAAVNTLTADVQARFGNTSRQTVAEYLSEISRLFVIEEIPQWFPELRDKLRLRKAPKRMLCDPSIAVGALRADAAGLARDPRTLGSLFENLCMRDLLIYAESIDARLSHYRDASGLEVDAIVEYGQKWAAIEIKLGAHRVDEAVLALTRLCHKMVNKGAAQPAFLAVMTGGGPLYTREDGVHVLPVDCLGP
jgi:predicted AAA+ superfamily ATPase